MQKKLLSLMFSIIFVLGFSFNGFSAEISHKSYTISDNSDVLDFPDSSSPYMQKYRKSLYDKMVDPGKALALSALYFGLGQLYSGDTKKGAWIMAGGTVLAAAVLLVIVPRLANRQEGVTAAGSALSYGVLAAAYLWNIRDAYLTAENINKDINEKLLLSDNLLKQLQKINLSAADSSVILSYRVLDF